MKSVPKYIAEWNEGIVFSGNTELSPLWAAILGLSDENIYSAGLIIAVAYINKRIAMMYFIINNIE